MVQAAGAIPPEIHEVELRSGSIYWVTQQHWLTISFDGSWLVQRSLLLRSNLHWSKKKFAPDGSLINRHPWQGIRTLVWLAPPVSVNLQVYEVVNNVFIRIWTVSFAGEETDISAIFLWRSFLIGLCKHSLYDMLAQLCAQGHVMALISTDHLFFEFYSLLCSIYWVFIRF